MKKQTKQDEPIIDTFGQVSLYQIIPSGRGMAQSLLKTFIDSIHIGRTHINSLLIVGKSGAKTIAGAFLRSVGMTDFNETDASLLQNVYDLHIFICNESNEGYIIGNIEHLAPSVIPHLYDILKRGVFRPYNYVEKKHDYYEIRGMIIMTSKNISDVPKPILDTINYIVELEEYTTDQLELIVLQRLKYAHIDYANEHVLKNIVKYGKNNLDKCVRFMMFCIAIMQADGRQKLSEEDVIKGARLCRLSDSEKDNDSDIPF